VPRSQECDLEPVAAAATTAAAALAAATVVAAAATAATAAAEAAAATTTAAEAAAATTLALLRDVHADLATFELGAVQLIDRVLSRLLVGHRDEGEAARTAGLSIRGKCDFTHLAGGRERLFDDLLAGSER